MKNKINFTTKQMSDIELEELPNTGYLIHRETNIVFDENLMVIGRYVNNEVAPLDDEAVELCLQNDFDISGNEVWVGETTEYGIVYGFEIADGHICEACLDRCEIHNLNDIYGLITEFDEDEGKCIISDEDRRKVDNAFERARNNGLTNSQIARPKYLFVEADDSDEVEPKHHLYESCEN